MSLLEFFPKQYPGLHWEAAAGLEVDVPGGFVLAEVERGRVAVANVSNPDLVVVGTPADLVALKQAFAEGRFDYLLSGGVGACDDAEPDWVTGVASESSGAAAPSRTWAFVARMVRHAFRF